MYLIHFTVMRRDRVREVGGFRPGYEGSQDHDLALRVTEGGRGVLQVPESLYLWRMIPTSTAADPDSKPYARVNGVRACQDHFDRRGLRAVVKESEYPGLYLIDRTPQPGSSASVIIPTRGTKASLHGRNAEALVVNAVRSMLAHPQQIASEYVVVYDVAADQRYLRDLRALLQDRLVLVPYDKPFNFSEKCNLGAVHASGDVLVFANDDLEIISPRWLDQLTALVQQPDVGAAGALLYFEDGSIQHAGHTFVRGSPTHAYLGERTDVGYFGDVLLEHEVAGVTAALIACRTPVFKEVGGFTLNLPGNYNDVDFNLKIRHAGYRIVLSPRVTAWHYESRTRDATVLPRETKFLRARWEPQLRGDPYRRV
jgi:hypothetical protein